MRECECVCMCVCHCVRASMCARLFWCLPARVCVCACDRRVPQSTAVRAEYRPALRAVRRAEVEQPHLRRNAHQGRTQPRTSTHAYSRVATALGGTGALALRTESVLLCRLTGRCCAMPLECATRSSRGTPGIVLPRCCCFFFVRMRPAAAVQCPDTGHCRTAACGEYVSTREHT